MSATAGLPPGSRLPAAAQTALFVRDPVRFLEGCRRRYGPVFRVRFVGFPRFAYVAEPDLARQLYAADRSVGRAGDARRELLAPLVGASSILCLEDDEWLRHRKLLGPAFHARLIASYRDRIAAIARAQILEWPLNEPFALRPRMQAITLEVILRLVFGISDELRLRRLRELLPGLLEAGGSPLVWLIPPQHWPRLQRWRLFRRLPRNPIAGFLEVKGAVDALLHEEIAERRRAARDGARASVSTDSGDVLSMLLASRDESGAALSATELRDELVTLLEAGHETTATALAWSFERLLRHQDVLDRLEAELEQGSPEYLDAVVKESLRSRPVVVDTPRRLSGDLELGDYRIPAGWDVAAAIPLVHRASGVYPDAAQFRPERFLQDEVAPGAWIPFGGGKRHCLGSHLALLEMRVVITEVLTRMRLEAADRRSERQRMHHVTLVPAASARVVARPKAGTLAAV